MSVETSIVVQFQNSVASADANVTVEIDPEHENNLVKGELQSTFSFVARPVFLLNYDPTVLSVESINISSGFIQQIGSNIVRRKEQEISFASNLIENAASLSYSNISLISSSWYGNAGIFEIRQGSIIPRGGAFPCIGNIVFDVLFNSQHRITPPDLTFLNFDETYKILIIILMKAAG